MDLQPPKTPLLRSTSAPNASPSALVQCFDRVRRSRYGASVSRKHPIPSRSMRGRAVRARSGRRTGHGSPGLERFRIYKTSMIGKRLSPSRQAAAKSAVPTSPVKSESGAGRSRPRAAPPGRVRGRRSSGRGRASARRRCVRTPSGARTRCLMSRGIGRGLFRPGARLRARRARRRRAGDPRRGSPTEPAIDARCTGAPLEADPAVSRSAKLRSCRAGPVGETVFAERMSSRERPRSRPRRHRPPRSGAERVCSLPLHAPC